MFGKWLWNPATEPDKSKGPNMYSQSLWNLAMRPDMSGLTGVFGGRIDFDVLHFNNSPIESLMIVRSS
jgi:hypothetical protein